MNISQLMLSRQLSFTPKTGADSHLQRIKQMKTLFDNKPSYKHPPPLLGLSFDLYSANDYYLFVCLFVVYR